MTYPNPNNSTHLNDDYYKKFYGKYRGKVVNNEDPENLGRIIAEVPAIPASKLNYATPCVPYADSKVGFFAIPPVNANVWIEFEGGDPNFPIWSGCFWGEEELPIDEAPPTTKFFITDTITMTLNDLEDEGGFTLQCKPPAVNVELSMTFNSEGITIKCPESQLTMTTEKITHTVPDAEISITAEEIKATVPQSNIAITSEKISAEVPSSKLNMTGESIEIKSADINLSADDNVKIDATKTSISGNVSIDGSEVEIEAPNTSISGKVSIKA